MPTNKPHTVDAVTLEIDLEHNESRIGLVITEYRRWDQEPQMQEELKRKLETYYCFANSDAYRQRYGSAKPMVVLYTVYQPTPEIYKVLERFTEVTKIKTRCDAFPPEKVAEFEQAMEKLGAILGESQPATKAAESEGWLARLRRFLKSLANKH